VIDFTKLFGLVNTYVECTVPIHDWLELIPHDREVLGSTKFRLLVMIITHRPLAVGETTDNSDAMDVEIKGLIDSGNMVQVKPQWIDAVKELELNVGHEPFLRAIISNPADDGPRLVYADWLDERGQPERAEFIRLQIELMKAHKCKAPAYTGAGVLECAEWNARHPSCNDWCVPCASRRELRHREQELLKANWQSWVDFQTERAIYCDGVGSASEGFKSGKGIVARFRRGFVAKVELTSTEFVGGRCGQCNGTGWVGVRREYACFHCLGTGYTRGLAQQLAECCPLEEVVLTDLEPYQAGDREWRWFEPFAVSERPKSNVLRFLYDRMSGPPYFRSIYGYKSYESEAIALNALSDACVKYARSLIPWLQPKKELVDEQEEEQETAAAN
jgi:uncharacterized protein (TIGR02996 family)